MKSRMHRILCLCALMLVIGGALIYRMTQLQLVQGSQTAASLNANVVRKYDELASRGEILDRNGEVMVGNALRFSVQLDYYEWERDRQNEVILELYHVLDDAGAELNDVLPLSWEAPIVYTYDSLESGDGRKLRRFVEKREWGDLEEMSTARLLGLLSERYDVPDGITLQERRAIVGMRYYMEDYQFSSYNTPIEVVEEVDIQMVAALAQKNAALPGVTVQVSDSREYHTDAAAHVLGRVATISPEEYEERRDQGYDINDTIGRDGMERALEDYLRGQDGQRAVEVDRRTGQVVAEYMLEDPQPGKNCYLTLDLGLQERLEQSLEETLDAIRKKGERSRTHDGADAEGGAAVVIDVRNGEVLAMASWPTYSLATFSEDFKENNANELKPFFNRAVQAPYSPGSTFKMCTAVAALEEGVITPNTRIRDEGIYKRYADVGYAPRCWLYRQHGRTHGNINVSQAIQYSCNYFFYEMGYRLQIEKLDEYARMFGLGEKTGIELSGEAAGNLAGPESREKNGGAKWYAGDTLMAAIGQSDHQFTPLQLANYVATLVNGGQRFRPHLLKKVMDYTDTVTYAETQPEVLNTVEMKDSTVEAVKKGMKGVVTEDGTASSYFAGFPMKVGGKTGSAQMINHSATGVFVSFAPYDDPEIAVCVVGEYTSSGGSLAPVAIAAYDEYFDLGLFEAPDPVPETP